VLINEGGDIKLIDLGLSLMGDQSQVKIAGTPFFMCPELLHGKEYDPFKADIWAFGILLYWLALGYFPQDSQSKKKGQSKFELNFPADMHPGVEYLISKMLAEDPADRI
jgi:serine/threonine protein kinase